MSRTLDEIIETIGLQPAIELTRRYGGRKINIPTEVTERHAVALCIGLVAARRLAAVYGGGDLKIPAERTVLLKLRNEQIVTRWNDGASINGLAGEYGIDRTMIYKVLRKAGVMA